jgi:hypothetical protein
MGNLNGNSIQTNRSTGMKKTITMTALLVALYAVTGYAQGDGAVKIDFDPPVGWVILNTTAGGKLIATAHVNDGRPNQEFTISVRVRYEDDSMVAFTDVATLTTNGQGKGNVQVQLDVDPPDGSTTLRRVAFRARRPGPPNILYLAVAWDLPLK